MKIVNINEALDYIYSFMGKKNLHKEGFDHINNVRNILNTLGYKQTFDVIHITGTKGKGSTTLVLSHMLKHSGFKTGAFISPHIIDERERISINDEWISEKDFVYITNKIKNIVDNDNYIYENITVFEIFTIIGLYYFYMQEVDYACVEVGIGGKLDCTNVVDSAISILTSISYDHTQILGDTIEKITEQKAGIIKPNSMVISAYQEENSINIIKNISEKQNSKLYIFKKDFDAEIIKNSNENLEFIFKENNKEYTFNTTLLGEHQAENISLSFKAFRILLEKRKNIKNTEKIYASAINSLKTFDIKARLTFMQRNPDIIVDGAHNAKSLDRVLKTVYKWYKDIIILFAPLSEKDVNGMCNVLKQYDSIIILSSSNSITYKETDSYKVYEYLKDYDNVKHIPNFNEAIEYMKKLSKEKNMPALVIGSLYAASDFINTYKK